MAEIELSKPMTADELKAAIAALPPMSEVEPAHTWEFWAWDLRQNILTKDPAEFLTWPGVVGTMFVGNAPYIDYELDVLLKNNWAAKCAKILDDPDVGRPTLSPEYTINANIEPGNVKFTPSGNLIHQYYHLWQWERETGQEVSQLDTIVEVGGGYGAMALIIHRLGFKGRYIILDLPEFSLLQQYYLSNVGVEGVEFVTQIDKQIECDLLVGLYSLTEMPLHVREAIVDLCPAQSYLIAYGANWGARDNIKWGAEMTKMRRPMPHKGYLWHSWNVEHLPNCWYLVGGSRK